MIFTGYYLPEADRFTCNACFRTYGTACLCAQAMLDNMFSEVVVWIYQPIENEFTYFSGASEKKFPEIKVYFAREDREANITDVISEKEFRYEAIDQILKFEKEFKVYEQ